MEDCFEGHKPFIQETQRYKSLHFSLMAVQSRMLKREPDRLIVDYTRTMMGFLLFNREPARIAMLGLGGGSIAKFCYRELPASRIDVVEINPHVVALRDEFHLPPDDGRFKVHVGDGARFVKQASRKLDVLMVDAYTTEGIAPQLATPTFYDDCRRCLAGNGVMIMNLYCDDAQIHLEQMRRTFQDAVFVVAERDKTNRVAFACAGDSFFRPCPDVLDALGRLSPQASTMLRPAVRRVSASAQKQFRGRFAAPAPVVARR